MTLSNFKTNTSFEYENITNEELNELRIREKEEDIDFDDLKKYVSVNKKLVCTK